MSAIFRKSFVCVITRWEFCLCPVFPFREESKQNDPPIWSRTFSRPLFSFSCPPKSCCLWCWGCKSWGGGLDLLQSVLLKGPTEASWPELFLISKKRKKKFFFSFLGFIFKRKKGATWLVWRGEERERFSPCVPGRIPWWHMKKKKKKPPSGCMCLPGGFQRIHQTQPFFFFLKTRPVGLQSPTDPVVFFAVLFRFNSGMTSWCGLLAVVKVVIAIESRSVGVKRERRKQSIIRGEAVAGVNAASVPLTATRWSIVAKSSVTTI